LSSKQVGPFSSLDLLNSNPSMRGQLFSAISENINERENVWKTTLGKFTVIFSALYLVSKES
jgi:hypothetical protein